MKKYGLLLIICGIFGSILLTSCDDLFDEPNQQYTVLLKNQSNFKANLYMVIFYSDNSGKGLSYEEFQVPDTEVSSLGSRYKEFSFPYYADKEKKDLRSYYGNFYAATNGSVKASKVDVLLTGNYITVVWTGNELIIED